jgi:hypothetical protein
MRAFPCDVSVLRGRILDMPYFSAAAGPDSAFTLCGQPLRLGWR